MSAHRSLLFAPGDHARRVGKALLLDADAVILDLEDAVAVAAKTAARGTVAAALRQPRSGRAYVRVNGFETPYGFGDVQAVVGPGLDGIVLPKLEEPGQALALHWMIGALERERGLPEGGIDLLPIIETARGMAAARELARAAAALGGRVKRLAFGAGDYTLDLGIAWSAEERELDPARAEIVLASRMAGLEAPIDTVWIELGDRDGYQRSCARGVGLGFQGRFCIHPDQVPVANAAYAPTAAAVARAEQIVAAFAEAEAKGLASIQVDGRFIDYPIVAQARRLLQLHGAIEAARRRRGEPGG